ncbi:hypothetical protein AMAG_16664 [Allomyces macrogynus ATCC 38327]|uniref:Glycoside hydrolase family 19 catalytic domain-containing protein n=1 Tax=Allomyces macrogynus (strain ATCC 38327) TaxID=578462 RepID=A0A0L0TBN8_ALLM3|nr:hypothetical protein AMAG_16664 [Allomyces macrogynus ATCC 38327]|eukprot:KNE72177.1 hypothetical protein AMAG_16664 [Allomyces macrogynus ATCC 38327]
MTAASTTPSARPFLALLAAVLAVLLTSTVATAATTPSPTSTPAPIPAPNSSNATCSLATDAVLASVLADPASRSYWPSIRTAAAQYSLCTPARLAVYLATMSHETAGLTVLYQPKTGGRGAIMMIPANWHFAFTSLHDPAVLARLNNDANRTDSVAADLMMDPGVMFRVAAWWFRGGAATAGMKSASNATACNDLGAVADGMGGKEVDRKLLATINECVAGNGDQDPGFEQRVALTGKVLRAVQEVGNATVAATATRTVASTSAVGGARATPAPAKAAASGIGEQSSAARADGRGWASVAAGAVVVVVVAVMGVSWM